VVCADAPAHLEIGDWAGRLTQDDLRGITPLLYQHVNPYGWFHLDMHERLPIDPHEAAA
jgi:hypothetical protein